MSLYDEGGRRFDLSATGHSGGEGTVHRIVGDASRVAKIYHAGRLRSDLRAKLRVMLEHRPTEPSRNGSGHRSIAWVDGLVFADPGARDLRGFTMPYVDTTEFRQAHVYYDAADRVRMFGGEFTWRHLLFAAHNLASAVAAVHAAGHRVGDLRETNLLVAPSSLVTLIDCDSFQIRDPRTQDVYPTRVATGDYLPPELQNVDFGTQQPDRYHGDLFALAVLVFRFLMLGVHPFQARGAGVVDTPTTEAKIRKGLFAFAGRHRGVQPPDYAPAYSIVPAPIRDLFARAFVRGHGDPQARPSAAEWVTALETEARRLRTCPANPDHLYAHRLRSCPWCRTTPDPFPARAFVGRQIALKSAGSQVSEGARIEQVRAYARVALADGAVTDKELAYLRKAGGELGLRTLIVDRVIDDEARHSKKAPVNGNGSSPIRPSASVVPSMKIRSIPAVVLRGARDRRTRSALKATAPVVVACAIGGALAPAVAFAVAAVVALPALAVVGDLRSAPGWRARARLPLSYAIHLSRALGHAAQVALPVALLGFVASKIPGVPTESLLRATGAAGMSVFAWLAIARLPYSHDRSATALREGRDVVWRVFVGESGRSRRPVYAMWAICLVGALAVGASYALWWPLPVR